MGRSLAKLLSALALLGAHTTEARPEGRQAAVDPPGINVHRIASPYQSGKLLVRVLVPDRREDGKKYPVVYVLPVEARDGDRFGDGLLEIKKLGLQDQYRVVFVAPTFSTVPWYADHPTNAELRQESHFLKVVVPLIEKNYPVRMDRAGRLLLGFSKSGAGAFALILRHSDTFGKALAFDAPLMRETFSKGREIFASPENFDQYCVPKLLRKQADKFAGERRLLLLGTGFLQAQHRQAHLLMESLKIAHEFREGPRRKHAWNSGWIAEAVDLLLPKGLR